jgi:hypothetical protein
MEAGGSGEPSMMQLVLGARVSRPKGGVGVGVQVGVGTAVDEGGSVGVDPGVGIDPGVPVGAGVPSTGVAVGPGLEPGVPVEPGEAVAPGVCGVGVPSSGVEVDAVASSSSGRPEQPAGRSSRQQRGRGQRLIGSPGGMSGVGAHAPA